MQYNTFAKVCSWCST